MDVLVLAASGLLGSNVVTEALGRGNTVGGTYHTTHPSFDVPLTQLDIRDQNAFTGVLDEYEPDAVVNCAAITNVDLCEKHPDKAFEVNGRAPGRLASACSGREIAFIHVSTDYVFGGETAVPYDETAATDPLQTYGASKLHGEKAVLDAHPTALIPRLSFVWGIHRSSGDLAGFPAWVRSRLQTGESSQLFTDQYVTPSRAGAAAKTILELVAAEAEGLFHVASRSCITPYIFGVALCDRLNADGSLIEEGQQTAVDRSAPRPQNTCLDVHKVEATLGRAQPTLNADLDTVEPRL